jgi:hypothetical protein
MQSRCAVILVAVLASVQLPAGAQNTGVPRELPFVDEAPSDPGFLAFRSSLLDAVASRDSAYILSIVSDRIRNSFGGDGGIDEFERFWQPDSQDSRFWTEFETALRLGGAFRCEDSFVAPYTTATWPNDLDGYAHAAVIGTNVNVRSE